MFGVIRKTVPALAAGLLGGVLAAVAVAQFYQPAQPHLAVIDLRQLVDARKNRLLLEEHDLDKAGRELKAYIEKLQQAIERRAASGEVILVMGAVVAGGRDITSEVKRALEKD